MYMVVFQTYSVCKIPKTCTGEGETKPMSRLITFLFCNLWLTAFHSHLTPYVQFLNLELIYCTILLQKSIVNETSKLP